MKKYSILLVVLLIFAADLVNAQEGPIKVNFDIDLDFSGSASSSSVKFSSEVTAYGVVGKSFVLDGTRSMDDESAGEYKWTQIRGPLVSLVTSSDGKTSFIPKQAGTYEFELIATDNTGLATYNGKLSVIVSDSGRIMQNNQSDIDFLRTQAQSDDDNDGVMFLSGVEVRGWDPEKKESFLREVKTEAQIRSGQDLENFATGVLLKDDSIDEAEVATTSVRIVFKEQAKFLGIFATNLKMEVNADAEGRVKVRYPWFSFLYKKPIDASEVEVEIEEELSQSQEVKAKGSFQATAKMFSTISNVLKTKHDTAKNSIGNIR